MSPPPIISLFSERPELNQRSPSFVVSILAHGAALGLVSFGFLSTPQIKSPTVFELYTVRRLDLHTMQSLMRQAVRSQIEYPRPRPVERKLSAAARQAMRQIASAAPGRQTLIQPDLLKPLPLPQQISLPTVVIWNGEAIPVKTILAPLPKKPAVADVKPSVQRPNQEQRLADLSLAASDLAAQDQPLLPGTTSPVVVNGPQPTPPAPVTTAEGSAEPTPIAVMSLSDLNMANGDVTLPPANQSASLNPSGELAVGRTKGSAGPGQGQTVDDAGQSRTGNAAGAPDPNAAPRTFAPGALAGNPLSTAHITLPKNGQFGAVVVGASMDEEYPEIAHLWDGRLGYTVYLHVGLEKSWILQYSLPPDAEAAKAGEVARIEPPWPYNIVRPNLAAGAIDADALMIHGFVNQDGRFESLSIAFPPQFPEARFVLNSLAQWQFRPARQNGKNVRVEVLLVIPDEQQ